MGDRELVQSSSGRDIESQSLQIGSRVRVNLLSIDQSQRTTRLATQKDVRRHVQVIKGVELLMYQGNPQVHSGIDIVDLHRLAVEQDLAGIRLVDAAQDLHQR